MGARHNFCRNPSLQVNRYVLALYICLISWFRIIQEINIYALVRYSSSDFLLPLWNHPLCLLEFSQWYRIAGLRFRFYWNAELYGHCASALWCDTILYEKLHHLVIILLLSLFSTIHSSVSIYLWQITWDRHLEFISRNLVLKHPFLDHLVAIGHCLYHTLTAL